MASADEPIILRPGESRGRLDRTLKVGGADTDNGFALRVVEALPPGRWIPEHRHQREAEAWYVLSGELTFRLAGQDVVAPTGSFILVPRGMVHGFGNRGAQPAAFLELFSPAGMEGYFEERAALAQASTPGAASDYAGLEVAAHAALAQKYQMEFIHGDP